MRWLLLLALTAVALAAGLDLTVRDSDRHRDIPLKVYLPAAKGPAPVILFSHGLGGSREGSKFLGEGWAEAGYVAVFMQHPGSDESVWKGAPRLQVLKRLKAAASLENFELRVEDVHAVLDQLEQWNQKGPLAGRLDLAHVGMSGHSFGAVTTQAVSGQSYPVLGTKMTDPRIKAAIAFSPSPPRGGDVTRAFAQVRIPWMLMTGTEDKAVIGGLSPEDRLEVYAALPAGSKYELVLDGAQHSVFTDRALPGDRHQRNPRHHGEILQFSIQFWNAYLKNDPAARAWLDGQGALDALQPQDRWQHK